MIEELWNRWIDCVTDEGLDSQKVIAIETKISLHLEASVATLYPGGDKNKLQKDYDAIPKKITNYTGNNPNKFHAQKREIESKLNDIKPSAPRNEGIYRLFCLQGKKYPFKIGKRYYFCTAQDYGLSRSGKTSSGTHYTWHYKPSAEIDPFRADANQIEPKRGWKSKIMKAHSLSTYKQLDWYLGTFMSPLERKRLLA